jgi:hypothetical protein
MLFVRYATKQTEEKRNKNTCACQFGDHCLLILALATWLMFMIEIAKLEIVSTRQTVARLRDLITNC